MKKFLLLCFICICNLLAAQEGEMLLLSGKVKKFKSVDGSGFKIAYRTLEKNKLRSIAFERVFSLRYPDGTEKVVYQKDPYDSLDFTVDQMRMFIKGEQDADKYYHNNVNKVLATIMGVGSGYFAIYGIIGPPLYSTIMGNFSPKVKPNKVSDPQLISIPEYREGYERKCRDKKITQGLLFGFGGFLAGITTFAIMSNN
ncbi:MAG: hypothetical protein RIQ89_1534 [Bacteroidota bacterium]|jgi:hypothetical protein